MRTKSTGGFTLIELLIVIAIIGILAAVLIPNLLSARTRAFDTAAQSCAKSIATGQEIRVIDGLDYLEVTTANVTTDLEGTNACDGMTITAGAANGQLDYTATVAHPNGTTGVTFTVTEDGIERNP